MAKSPPDITPEEAAYAREHDNLYKNPYGTGPTPEDITAEEAAYAREHDNMYKNPYGTGPTPAPMTDEEKLASAPPVPEEEAIPPPPGKRPLTSADLYQRAGNIMAQGARNYADASSFAADAQVAAQKERSDRLNAVADDRATAILAQEKAHTERVNRINKALREQEEQMNSAYEEMKADRVDPWKNTNRPVAMIAVALGGIAQFGTRSNKNQAYNAIMSHIDNEVAYQRKLLATGYKAQRSLYDKMLQTSKDERVAHLQTKTLLIQDFQDRMRNAMNTLGNAEIFAQAAEADKKLELEKTKLNAQATEYKANALARKEDMMFKAQALMMKTQKDLKGPAPVKFTSYIGEGPADPKDREKVADDMAGYLPMMTFGKISEKWKKQRGVNFLEPTEKIIDKGLTNEFFQMMRLADKAGARFEPMEMEIIKGRTPITDHPRDLWVRIMRNMAVKARAFMRATRARITSQVGARGYAIDHKLVNQWAEHQAEQWFAGTMADLSDESAPPIKPGQQYTEPASPSSYLSNYGPSGQR